MSTLRIATRGSALALWQANFIRDALVRAHAGLAVELVVLTTRGDRILDTALDKIPGKGLFTKEIQEALLDGRADLAVHSLKDLPTELTPGLQLAAVLMREDPADAWISRDGLALLDLPASATVMTGSLRRSAQVLHARPDVRIVPIRGNVPTRLAKFRESSADAIILARAGLARLGLQAQVTHRLDPAEFLPACGQGAMAVEALAGKESSHALCQVLEDLPTRLCVSAERAFLSAMGGGCQAPLGAFAQLDAAGAVLSLTGMVASLDGSRLVRKSVVAEVRDMQSALKAGASLAQQVQGEGVDDILGQINHRQKESRETP